MNLNNVLRLAVVSFIVRVATLFVGLVNTRMDLILRFWALRHLARLEFDRAFLLLIHPISSIRYFEFDFCLRHIEFQKKQRILDVSSPREFAFYYCKRNPTVSYLMINPDHNDVEETKLQAKALEVPSFSVTRKKAQSLSQPNQSFDRVVSISVVEHIGGKGDSEAIREFWRVLKPCGKLILTTHVAKRSRVEYRKVDQYNQYTKKHKRYFFQRVYSGIALRKRILKHIPVEPYAVELIGEKQKGWFDTYISRWIDKGIYETVWDPWYMATQFRRFETIEELVGVGVICLAFKKPHEGVK